MAVRDIDNDLLIVETTPEQRACKFHHENEDGLYPFYSYSACTVLCRKRAQLDVCNCNDHFMLSTRKYKALKIKNTNPRSFQSSSSIYLTPRDIYQFRSHNRFSFSYFVVRVCFSGIRPLQYLWFGVYSRPCKPLDDPQTPLGQSAWLILRLPTIL